QGRQQVEAVRGGSTLQREGKHAVRGQHAANLAEDSVQRADIDEHVRGNDEVRLVFPAGEKARQIVMHQFAVGAAFARLLQHCGGEVDTVYGIGMRGDQRTAQAGAAAQVERLAIAPSLPEQRLQQTLVAAVAKLVDKVL